MAVLNTTPSDDATTSSRFPTYNYGTDPFNVAGYDGNGIYGTTREFCYGWMKFDLSSIPSGSTINSALLTMIYFYPTASYADFEVYLYRASTSWVETTITFNTQPSVTADVLGYTVTGDMSASFEVQHNMLTHVQNALAEGTSVSWRVHTADSFEGQNSGVSFGAKENSGGRPFLQVVYTEPAGTRRFIVSSFT